MLLVKEGYAFFDKLKRSGVACAEPFIIYTIICPKADTAIHRATPSAVGSRADNAVHLKLPVSFFIVRRVVEQGQWHRENSMTHRAVIAVQP